MPDNGYFAAEIAQEQLIEKSGIPFSLVHSTQFFEFARGIADEATVDGKVHMAPVLFQPIAGDDVAQAVGRTAVGSPLNGRVEVAGPEQFRMDEFFRQALTVWGDPREVVTDPHGRYFGGELSERSLVPGDGATLGTIGSVSRGACRARISARGAGDERRGCYSRASSLVASWPAAVVRRRKSTNSSSSGSVYRSQIWSMTEFMPV